MKRTETHPTGAWRRDLQAVGGSEIPLTSGDWLHHGPLHVIDGVQDR